jgi:hypothetical protein
MDNFEVDEILKSMEIVVDNREHKINRAERRYKRFGVPYSFGTLSYGDYTYNAVIDGQKLYDNSATILSKVVIERKMSLDELAMCFTRGRERFKKEFQRAMDQNAKVYLLVENGSYERIISHSYKSRYNPKAFLASLEAFQARYNMQVVFCLETTTPTLIKEILYRELKERLERGEFG